MKAVFIFTPLSTFVKQLVTVVLLSQWYKWKKGHLFCVLDQGSVFPKYCSSLEEKQVKI